MRSDPAIRSNSYSSKNIFELFFDVNENHNFYDSFECYVRNQMFRSFIEDGYWLDSWNLQTEEIVSSFYFTESGYFTEAGSVYMDQTDALTIRSVEARLGKLSNGKREYTASYWCGRSDKIVTCGEKLKEDKHGNLPKGKITVKEILKRNLYSNSYGNYPRYRKLTDSAAEMIDAMNLESKNKNLWRELFHHCNRVNVLSNVKSDKEFVNALIHEYKKARIQSL